MTSMEYEKRTTVNVKEKANLIWNIADLIRDLYKPHEYGKVILPMTVLKRFDDCLLPTKNKVLEENKTLNERKLEVKEGFLQQASGYKFYNISPFTFESLLSDPDNIEANLRTYLHGFSENIVDIMSHFQFEVEIKKLSDAGSLYFIIQEFNSKKAYMGPDQVTSTDMGNIFEELIRKFSESYNEQAGAHFTARDIIYLMTELLISEEKEDLRNNGVTKTVYDMAMGTSQMLGCMTEKLTEIDPGASVKCFGQELNPETFAIAKADMLIKGGNADDMKLGDTLKDDKFSGYTFDYIISNPPFGIDWKVQKEAVEREFAIGDDGRFGPGLPSISDGQMLFMLNGIKKLKEGSGRMAIIQNGSSLFTGDAGSGPSEIRKHVIENDLLDAIVQLPNDLFYNTGISTYIWLITKSKEEKRAGTVQLIDASNCYNKKRKSIGNKRNELSDKDIEFIAKVYDDYFEGEFNQDGKTVSSKIFENEDFGYNKITVESPLIDENGKYVLKNGKVQSDSDLRDTETIPLKEDIDTYFEREVKPFSPNAWIDKNKTKIGYEIPFTRYFYKYIAPEKSDVIAKRIIDIEAKLMASLRELFPKDGAING